MILLQKHNFARVYIKFHDLNDSDYGCVKLANSIVSKRANDIATTFKQQTQIGVISLSIKIPKETDRQEYSLLYRTVPP